jgi:AraC family transcriptional regulator of adaptative response/methylated-DNA-[protein]-cysteine methyltransferase
MSAIQDNEIELDAERCWQAVEARDGEQDGRFVFAVRSTGIYCRPSCASRRPRRENVRFFALPAAAELAGYRACKRCTPQKEDIRSPQVATVAKVCTYIEAHLDEPLTLEQLGEQVALSPSHLQRIFTRLLGVSPREYADALRIDDLKQRLRADEDVSGALYSAGYSSSSRLYERADSQLGMTPNTYKRGGKGMTITYTSAPSPLGTVLVASTERGVCAIYLGDDEDQLAADLRKEYPAAAISRDEGELGAAMTTLQQYLDGERPAMQLPLDVQATAFQRRVWQALQNIPYGETRSYGEIAAELGNPNAVRAVGRACATNPVSLLVPCHRAVGGDGKLHGYGWGLARKQALLDMERGE